MLYEPGVWVIVMVCWPNAEVEYRLLGGWYSDYLGEDRWRINSGIVRIARDGGFFCFYGASGSCYRCDRSSYRLNHTMAAAFRMLSSATPGMSILDERTAPLEFLDCAE